MDDDDDRVIFDGFVPVAAGVTKAPDAAVLGDIDIAAERAKLSHMTRLSDIAEQYAFYQPGLLYSLVPLEGKDPLADFVASINLDKFTPLSFQYDLSVVKGFERFDNKEVHGWNYTLHAIERPVFEKYLPWVGSAVFLDRQQKLLWRIRHKELTIVDPAALANITAALYEQLPRITLTAFCLDTNRGCWYFKERRLGPPVLTYSSIVFPDTAKMARALLTEADDPLANQPEINNGE